MDLVYTVQRSYSETNITVLLGQYRGNQLTRRGQDLGYHAQSLDSGCQRGQVVTRCSDVQQECCTGPSTQGLYAWSNPGDLLEKLQLQPLSGNNDPRTTIGPSRWH